MPLSWTLILQRIRESITERRPSRRYSSTYKAESNKNPRRRENEPRKIRKARAINTEQRRCGGKGLPTWSRQGELNASRRATRLQCPVKRSTSASILVQDAMPRDSLSACRRQGRRSKALCDQSVRYSHHRNVRSRQTYSMQS